VLLADDDAEGLLLVDDDASGELVLLADDDVDGLLLHPAAAKIAAITATQDKNFFICF
jgi:hypothetical protein